MTTSNPAVLFGGDLPSGVPAAWSVSEAILHAAERESGFVFVRADGSPESRTYADLMRGASNILGALRARGLERGRRIVFQISDAEALLETFWACVLGGIVPVLQSPPRTDGSLIATRRLGQSRRILADPPVVTTADCAALVGLSAPEILVVEDLRKGPGDEEWSFGGGDDVALLILTSGSSGSPKLVRLTHANVMSGITAAVVAFAQTADDVSLNWLPLFHVGAFMRSLRDTFAGGTQIQVATPHIAEHPLAWLDLIDRYAVTMTWGPDTQLAMLANRAREVQTGGPWELSSLRSLTSSGEPVTLRTTRALAEVLAPFGFRANALNVAWGLTEACSATVSWNLDPEVRELAPDVGSPLAGLSVRVVGPGDEPANDGASGEVQIRGPQVACGYEGGGGRDAFTGDGWFRTGDLGFIRGGVLTINGRCKEVIRIGGVAYANREIEGALEELVHLEPSTVAATLVGDGDVEALAVFIETARGDTTLVHEVRTQLMRCSGFAPRFVIPLGPGEIPRTASGKVRRKDLREAFEGGLFQAWRRWPYDLRAQCEQGTVDFTEGERALAGRIASVIGAALGVSLGPGDDFFAAGINSLRVVEATARLEGLLSAGRCEVADLFHAPTPIALARRLLQRGVSHETEPGAAMASPRVGARAARAERAARRRA